MIPVREMLSALIVAGLLVAAFPARADVGPVNSLKGGGAAAPGSPHQAIRLDSQEVTIRLKGFADLRYTVDAVFHLFNTGETMTQWVGFPKWVVTDNGSHTLSSFIRFDAWVNGRKAKFTEEQDLSQETQIGVGPPPSLLKRRSMKQHYLHEERRWLIHQVTFPGHTPTTIRVTYEAPYYYDGAKAIYLYGTGSFWKGNIGKAVFIVDSGEVGGTENISISFEEARRTKAMSQNIRVRPWSISRNVVRFELRDFEPDPEARFVVRPYPSRKK